MNLTEMLGGNTAENAVWVFTRLRECYALTAEATDDRKVRTLVETRLNNLKAVGEMLPDTGFTDTKSTVQTSVSMIREALSIEDSGTSLNSSFPRQSEFNALPESSEKQHLLALLSLRSNTGNQGCMNALRFLESAISQEPANIVYRILAEAIHDSID